MDSISVILSVHAASIFRVVLRLIISHVYLGFAPKKSMGVGEIGDGALSGPLGTVAWEIFVGIYPY
jgi:hypothetical protein